MNRMRICLWMMLKRMGKHPVYWMLLLLFPAAFFAVPQFNRGANEKRILVGYVMKEAEDQQGEKQLKTGQPEEEKKEAERQKMAYTSRILRGIEYNLAEDAEDKENLFQYIKYTDTNDLKRDILTGELAGGVVFDENFAERLREQDYWQCITLYLPEGMNVGGIIQEDVFGKVYQVYSALWYTELLGQQGYQVEPEIVLQKFSEYQKQGKVFAVDYEIYEKNMEVFQNTAESGVGGSSMLSLRGILAFLTLMSASMGALDGSRDRERGVGKGMPGQQALAAITVGAPILPATLLLTVGMLLGNYEMTHMSYVGETRLTITAWTMSEIGSAFLYGLALWLLAMLFSRLLPRKLLEGIMPCFWLMVLLCCPIFLDLGENLPLIGQLSRMFPITWYLEFWG